MVSRKARLANTAKSKAVPIVASLLLVVSILYLSRPVQQISSDPIRAQFDGIQQNANSACYGMAAAETIVWSTVRV